MALTHKDVNLLTQKVSLTGTEKIPVSDTEYISPDQIVAGVEAQIVGVTSKEIDVVPGANYTAVQTQVSLFIPAGQTFNFTVEDVTCESSGKYALYLYYSDGTNSNPVNPDMNSTVSRSAAKDVIAAGAYISSGKITTGGKLRVALAIPGTIGYVVNALSNEVQELSETLGDIETLLESL